MDIKEHLIDIYCTQKKVFLLKFTFSPPDSLKISGLHSVVQHARSRHCSESLVIATKHSIVWEVGSPGNGMWLKEKFSWG